MLIRSSSEPRTPMVHRSTFDIKYLHSGLLYFVPKTFVSFDLTDVRISTLPKVFSYSLKNNV